MKTIFFYNFPILPCGLAIKEENDAVCGVFFYPAVERGIKKEGKIVNGILIRETPLIKNAAKQLDEYFSKKRKIFELPLSLNGTEFQVKVWKALQTIPYGETWSYGELAKVVGNSKASRAVGMANNKNPIAIIIPCHRVIGADGSLTGYAGGLDIKKVLLELEEN